MVDGSFTAETEDRSSGEGVTEQNAFELRDGEGSVDVVVKIITGRLDEAADDVHARSRENGDEGRLDGVVVG